jgi:hypothetical protein
LFQGQDDRGEKGRVRKKGNIYNIVTFPPQAGGNRREGEIKILYK